MEPNTGTESRNANVMSAKNGTGKLTLNTCSGVTLKDSDAWGNREDING